MTDPIQQGAMRHRPIYGGPFGRSGRYLLASVPCLERGLHAVRFSVLDPRSGTVLAVANDKREALDAARRRLRTVQPDERPRAVGQPLQGELWASSELPALAAVWSRRRKVPRRRREIYARSQGRCFYCATALQLEGDWHVEHQMPKAMGGTNEAINLVAACPCCNLGKSDRSAIEYVNESGE